MKKFFSKEIQDTVLYESEHFVVVPSLGSIIEGWVLIVPKDEVLNFSLLNEVKYSELKDLIETIKSLQNSFYGSSITFEHGPSKTCSKTGCGVDYAHLHLVPMQNNLMEDISVLMNDNIQWHEINSLSEIRRINNSNLDYLYFKGTDDKQFLTLRSEFPSQIFRQAIANRMSIPEKYDWKRFPEIENINKTILKFEKISICDEFRS